MTVKPRPSRRQPQLRIRGLRLKKGRPLETMEKCLDERGEFGMDCTRHLPRLKRGRDRMIETKSEPGQQRRSANWLQIVAVGRNPKTTLIRAAVLAVTCVVFFKSVLLPVRVQGISMTPTYADHSIHFVNRLAYLIHEPRRGDVVGIRLTPPNGWSAPHIMYFKRIIGLPGEAISFVGGHVLVDGH